MRSKSALKNILANLILQITAAISGLILPRFFIIAYGSTMNGMIVSVTPVSYTHLPFSYIVYKRCDKCFDEVVYFHVFSVPVIFDHQKTAAAGRVLFELAGIQTG